MRFWRFVVVVLTVAALSVSLAWADDTYERFSLGFGQLASAKDINTRGEVVGSGWGFFPPGSRQVRAFLWTGENGPTDLCERDGFCGGAMGINDQSVAVGYTTRWLSDPPRCAMWSEEGGLLDLGTLGGQSCVLYDVNKSNVAVGNVTKSDGRSQPILWSEDDGVVDLSYLCPSGDGHASAINDREEVTGWCEEETSRAFLWSEQHGQIWLTQAGESSQAYDVNNRSEVVGVSVIRVVLPGGLEHSISGAFIWEEHQGMSFLQGPIPAPSGSGTRGSGALGINDRGDVVGVAAGDGEPLYLPILWPADGGRVGLPWPHSWPYRFALANAINSAGEVVGEGKMYHGYLEALLWRPAGN